MGQGRGWEGGGEQRAAGSVGWGDGRGLQRGEDFLPLGHGKPN